MRPPSNRHHSLQQHLQSWCILLMAIVLLVAVMPVDAQEGSLSGNQVDGFPVTLDNQVLFQIKQDVPGVASVQERAAIISQRLTAIANNSAIPLDAIQIDEQGHQSLIRAGETILFTVSDHDASAYHQSRQELAQHAVQIIKTTVNQYRDERSIRRLSLGAIFTVLSTIALLIFLKTQQQLFSKLLLRIKVAQNTGGLSLRIQSFQVLSSDATSYLLTGFIQLMNLALLLGSLYLYIPFVLSQFPATKPFGDRILSDIAQRSNHLIKAFAQYLPNLITIAIIAFLTYYAIGFAKLVIAGLGRDNAYPWFYPEWTQPTIRLATLLIIVIACVITGPYLPGFGSPVFQGVSLFLGALLTLGSSSVVANALSGTILIYTRAFRIGDTIRIGDVFGEVVEKSLFVTRILTPKKEVITTPNSTVLSSNVTNFSAILRQSGGYLLLHTTITLGYEASWRQVHDVLVKAAEATAQIISEPSPFVLQTGLNDFHVSYELNAYTNRPELMPSIYSELHQNIQDHCNQAGIEILSPAYSALRDGNHSSIPTDYLPKDYTSPTFQIRRQDSGQQ